MARRVPRGDRPFAEGLRGVGHDLGRVEVDDRAVPLARRAGAERAVVAEEARVGVGEVEPAPGTAPLPVKRQLGATVFDDHPGPAQPLGERRLDRVEPPADRLRTSGQAVDDDVNSSLGGLGQGAGFEPDDLTADPDAGEPLRAERLGQACEVGVGRGRRAGRRRGSESLRAALRSPGRRSKGRPARRLRRSSGRSRGRRGRRARRGGRGPRRPSPGCSGPTVAHPFAGRRRWPAGCRRSGRRRACRAVRGTAGCRPRTSRRTAAAPRRRGCRTRANSCPTRSRPRRRPADARGRSRSTPLRLWTRTPRSRIDRESSAIGSPALFRPFGSTPRADRTVDRPRATITARNAPGSFKGPR